MERRVTYPTVGDLCRLDGAMVERIARGEGLNHIIVVASAVVLVGGGLYGYAFGAWRSAEQGVYSAVKLPLLLFAVVACTVLINGLMAIVLRTRLNVRQSAVCVLLALSISASMLGAFSPIALFLVSQAPAPLEGIVGLGSEHPLVAENLRVAQYVLVFHVVVIAFCGVVGNVRLFQLLEALTGSRAAARRLMLSWLAIDGFVGAQLSWLLRPFLCKPNLEPQMLRPDAFRGNFFEELWGIGSANAAWVLPLSLIVLMLLFFVLVLRALVRYSPRQKVWAEVTDDGLGVSDLTGRSALVPYGFVATIGPPSGGIIGRARHLDIDLHEELAFLGRQLRLMVSRSDDAERLYELISDACARAGLPRKPYR